jgi:membrane-bound lytic murein transglycosylase F
MITTYDVNNYFLRHGFEAGFEYELLNQFAEKHGLHLEVVFAGEGERPDDLLNYGVGDVIAANYTVTDQRRRYVNFSSPYRLSNKILVYSEHLDSKPESLKDFSGSGIPITLSGDHMDLQNIERLQTGRYDLNFNVLSDKEDTKSILTKISEGRILATAMDEDVFRVGSKYIQGLHEGPVIALNDTIAWAVRKNSAGLQKEMNRFLEDHFRLSENNRQPLRSAFLNQLRYRYHNKSPYVEDYYKPEKYYSSIGLTSSYEGLVRSVADSLDMDWMLLASMIVQESGFNNEAKSFAGAVGLMQILPRFSVNAYEDLYDPLTNVQEGALILQSHLEHYAYLDSVNQLSFALASYNVGTGHLIDARRLAMEQNRDPNKWENVEDGLLKLMDPRYFEQARHGYCRGIETVQYVKEIRNRYKTYQRVAAVNGIKFSGLPEEKVLQSRNGK